LTLLLEIDALTFQRSFLFRLNISCIVVQHWQRLQKLVKCMLTC